eukprot:TRINITY_DN2182_c0_g1_i1.p1 TRINITY_DN2182_c0_g1~~TRINITY_DN2182_c0_g1_i1.p1  ORF type:complete len:333 (-),score=44.23 TRINITY_DN2182_c0_g1_i1:23-1021(-)
MTKSFISLPNAFIQILVNYPLSRILWRLKYLFTNLSDVGRSTKMDLIAVAKQRIELLSQQVLGIANGDGNKLATRVTASWPLTRLDHALALALGYLVFVLLGSTIMKNFKSLNFTSFIKSAQMLYNPTQVILCIYMIGETIRQAFIERDYKLVCNEYDPNSTGIASILWVFYVSKVFDFLDTVFIVLGRKWEQLSFLHIYHHISIFLVYWMNINVGYDGDIYLTIILNSFVHLVMYYYYLLTSLGIRPWWKMYVTVLQMVQFIIMNIQAIYILVMGCPYPRNVTILYLVYIQSLFWLFASFFARSYGTKKPTTTTTSPSSSRSTKAAIKKSQ